MPIKRVYSTTLTGGIEKPVLCEHCDTAFIYVMRRAATGSYRTDLSTRQDEGQAASQELATQVLEQSFKEDLEPIACPGCGRYQENMVARLLERRHAVFRWGSIALIAVGLAMCLGYFSSHRVSLLRAVLFSFGAEVWIPGALLLGVLRVDARRFDPNAKAAQRIEAAKAVPGVRIITRDEFRAAMGKVERGIY